jgi:peptide/nickel transport system substrate-binding protein
MAQHAGVEVEVVNHPVDSYWSEVWMNRPFYLSNWSSRPMADQILSVAYLCESTWNESYWCNDRFDELVWQARETIDEDERFELYREAQEILVEDGGVIIPYFMSLNGAWNDHVQGYRMHPLRQVEFHRVWLDNGM